MTTTEIYEKLSQAFPEAKIRVTEFPGKADSFVIDIGAKEFEGLSLVEQHQIVYKALGERVQTEVHALTLNTHTQSNT